MLHQQWAEEKQGPLMNPRHPDVVLVGGLPKGIVDAITLLEARSLQWNRQQQVKAGTPHIAAWHSWKRLLYTRIRLRTHILKKDIRRREAKATAIAAGEASVRDTTRPADGNENKEFWHAWNKAEARDWNELQEWSSTPYLVPGKLREPKEESNKARSDRKKRRMQEDPAYNETVKAKEKQKRQDRKKRSKAKKAGAAAPSRDDSLLQSGGGDTEKGGPTDDHQTGDPVQSTPASSRSGPSAPMVKAAPQRHRDKMTLLKPQIPDLIEQASVNALEAFPEEGVTLTAPLNYGTCSKCSANACLR